MPRTPLLTTKFFPNPLCVIFACKLIKGTFQCNAFRVIKWAHVNPNIFWPICYYHSVTNIKYIKESMCYYVSQALRQRKCWISVSKISFAGIRIIYASKSTGRNTIIEIKCTHSDSTIIWPNHNYAVSLSNTFALYTYFSHSAWRPHISSWKSDRFRRPTWGNALRVSSAICWLYIYSKI